MEKSEKSTKSPVKSFFCISFIFIFKRELWETSVSQKVDGCFFVGEGFWFGVRDCCTKLQLLAGELDFVYQLYYSEDQR